jgi:hypothetical protein
MKTILDQQKKTEVSIEATNPIKVRNDPIIKYTLGRIFILP